jgi:hypothetical protein
VGQDDRKQNARADQQEPEAFGGRRRLLDGHRRWHDEGIETDAEANE